MTVEPVINRLACGADQGPCEHDPAEQQWPAHWH
jgi:hypothetical protein